MGETARAIEQQLWDLVYAYDWAFDRAAQDAGLTAAAGVPAHVPVAGQLRDLLAKVMAV